MHSDAETASNSEKFSVFLSQSPRIGRMCGVMETNTLRLLDPPLILELKLHKRLSISEMDYIANSFTCKLNLFDFDTRLSSEFLADANRSRNSVNRNNTRTKPIQNFVGKTVTTAKLLRDSINLETSKKLFFVFPQLSVRTSGRYYISCAVSNLKGFGLEPTVIVDTPPFEVYTAYFYPGNLQITPLSRLFHQQGVNIRGGNFSTCPKRKYGSDEEIQ